MTDLDEFLLFNALKDDLEDSKKENNNDNCDTFGSSWESDTPKENGDE